MSDKKLYNDIIQAFRDKDHEYYFDKKNNRVVVLSMVDSVLWGNYESCQLVSIERNKDNFVKIYKYEIDDEFEMIDDFCYEFSDIKELTQAVNSENPFDAFYQVLLKNKELETAWQEFVHERLYKEAKKFICRI